MYNKDNKEFDFGKRYLGILETTRIAENIKSINNAMEGTKHTSKVELIVLSAIVIPIIVVGAILSIATLLGIY